MSPELPPLHARTTTELALELQRARPAATVPLPAVRTRRRPPVIPLLLVALALAALAIGLVAAFSGGSAPPKKRPLARVSPVPHAATPEQQARNLARWLSRYSR